MNLTFLYNRCAKEHIMGSVGTVSARKIMSIVDTDGTVVDLPSELRYGTDKGANLPQSVSDFENRRASSKIEYGFLATATGKVLEECRGGKSRVLMTERLYAKADIFTHIHPGDRGLMSGTLSPTDLEDIGKYRVATIRAVAKEGTYSLSKGENFDASIEQAYRKAYDRLSAKADKDISEANAQAEALRVKLNFDYRLGKISYSELQTQWKAIDSDYEKACAIANNKYLLGLHNWLLQNQKRFGYTYALEKRG